jgi:hypothetical protein
MDSPGEVIPLIVSWRSDFTKYSAIAAISVDTETNSLRSTFNATLTSSKWKRRSHLPFDTFVFIPELAIETSRHIVRARYLRREEEFDFAIWLSCAQVEPRVSQASNAYGRKNFYVGYLSGRERHDLENEYRGNDDTN